MYEIFPIPLTDKFSRSRVEKFLSGCGLGMSQLDCWLAVTDADGTIVAGGGLEKDVIKCIAVDESLREEGLTNKLVSALISLASEKGYHNVKVFTKPSNRVVFESLGFSLVGSASDAILMENGGGLEKLLSRLRAHRVEGRCGAIVLNANPLTWGHDSLVRTACTEVDKLFLIPVAEDRSMFSYKERLQAVSSAFLDEHRVEVVECGQYCISAATFPSYFIKDASAASRAQMELDLDIFARHIAPALGVTVRYVGSEPSDPMTAMYNSLMPIVLGPAGIETVEMPRACIDGEPISASKIRDCIANGDFCGADAMAHPESMPMMVRALAERALRLELELPHKPGLVSPSGNGAHRDMDYALMLRSIEAISPFFHDFASINPDDDVAAEMIETGRKAEKAMLEATGGVNTHRGAIFALGLLSTAFAQAYWEGEEVSARSLRKYMVNLACAVPKSSETHGAQVVKKYKVKGALQNAREGYPMLFADWLALYRQLKGTENALMKVLLRIISSLDDTNILWRKGKGAADIARNLSSQAYKDLGKLLAAEHRFEREGISPGGSADMLSLTILADSLLCN